MNKAVLDTLSQCIRLLCARFAGDPSAPGVLTSWLEEGAVWYASAVRYRAPFGGRKQVVSSVRGADLAPMYVELLERLKET